MASETKFFWSKTRKNIFDSCKLQYYFRYYLSYNGWEYDCSSNEYKAHVLKKVVPLDTLVGILIHNKIKYLIQDYSQGKKIIDEGDLITNVNDHLIRIYRNSMQLRDEFYKIGENDVHYIIQELYYRKYMDTSKLEKINELINKCINNFFKSITFNEITSGKCTFIEIDEDKFESILINDIAVFSKIDLLNKLNNKYILVDWKTGNFSINDKEQLLIYCLYVSNKYKIPLQDISARVEYLSTGENISYSLNKIDEENIKNIIKNSSDSMINYIVNKNNNMVKNNENLKYNPSSSVCNRCNFIEICNV